MAKNTSARVSNVNDAPAPASASAEIAAAEAAKAEAAKAEAAKPEAAKADSGDQSQLGASEDAPAIDPDKSPERAPEKAPETELEKQGRERAEKRAALEAEAAAKEAAAMEKRDLLAAEAAEEKARMREAEKANTITEPPAPQAQPEADFDPFTVPLGTLSDDDVLEQWDVLQSVEADLEKENQKRQAKLDEHERIKQQMRLDEVELEKAWLSYQRRVNQVLLPRRTAIAREIARREKVQEEAAAAKAAGNQSGL